MGRSVDFLAQKEYTYSYREGTLIRAKEYAITVENGIITGRTVITTVSYTYNADGVLTKKQFSTADGTEWTVNYENPEEGSPIVRFTANGKTITSRSKTDSFGRKTFEELQLGSTFISRQFAYHEGKITAEHSENDKVKSAATTQLVSKITLSDGRTLSYTYDEEERIICVVETAENNGNPIAYTTEYTYDAMGQLLTEVVNGELVNEMTYDGYGNILTKNGKNYTYGDSVWKDKLTAIDNQPIVYDAQGNPTTYLGYALTWEKGRQLKTFGTNSYTYNANGIRTSKTVNGITHSYTLDGTNILCEKWDNNTLIPLRDNEDQVCGILYNGTPYYFLKNLQGDIIAIQDSNAQTIARYTYDAWGACTITEDTTDLNIATINPYRYRGYYYDTEIGMYYLQSRYYDPATGRFVNGDFPDTIANISISNTDNLFCYCCNNPVNEIDACGNLVASAIAKFVLYAVFGIFVQFVSDVIEFLLRKFIKNKNVSFSISPLGDYLGSALSWGMCSLNLFNSKLAAFISPFAPVILKHLTNIIRGSFSWYALLVDLIAAFIAGIISVALNKTMKNNLNQVKRGKGNRYSDYAKYLKKKQTIKIKINKSFFKASVTIVIATTLMQMMLNLLLK